MSSLAWVVFDEAERDRARRIMALFNEREARDELGIGAIRDSIADLLFPGTSVVHTRLRYMLFVPWLFQDLEASNVRPGRASVAVREREIRFIEALLQGGEQAGVIGVDARERLSRLPSMVYWAGLGVWGIRRFEGSIESYLEHLPLWRRLRKDRSEEAAADGLIGEGAWHPGLPPPPDDFPDVATFRLRTIDAAFVVDRLVASAPTSLLTHLAKGAAAADCDFIWEHPHRARFPAGCERLVEHGRLFSDVLHGASLLYNLMLAERRDWAEQIDRYRAELDEWTADLDLAALEAWTLDDFWDAIETPQHSVRPLARTFVAHWRSLVLADLGGIAESDVARRAVEARERRLKGAQSRFANQAALDRWSGASAAGRLAFRWDAAASHIADLAHAG
ncbi:MAG: DUF6361 family protein [Nitratireductor sp.]